MIEYIQMSLVSLAFAFVVDKKKKEGRRVAFYFLLSILPLIIVSSIRVNIGTDYSNYEYYFLRTWTDGSIEYGYALLQRLIRVFTSDFRYLLVVTSFVFVFISGMGIYELSDNYVMSLFLLIFGQNYFESMCHIRFMIAVAIITYSIKYVRKRDFVKFLICFLLAFGFHRIAVVAIVLYFTYGRKLRVIEFPILLLLGYLIGKNIWKFVSILGFSSYFKYLSESTNTLYGLLLLNIMIFLFFTTVGLVHWTQASIDKEYVFFVRVQYFAVVIALLSSFIPYAGRIATIFESVQLLSIPYILNHYVGRKYRKIVYIAIVIAFLFYCYHSIIVNVGFGVYPYQHI